MKKEKSPLFGKNLFAEAFRQFDEERFFERLEEQVKPQSYFHKYKGFKTVITTLSYLFNIVSAFTASYLIFWLTQWLTGISLVAYALSAVFLFFMEQLKRKSSGEFFQVWFFEKKIASGWLGLSLAVFVASVASTYYGADKATWDFAPSAPIVTEDSTLNTLYAQLDVTEKQIADARKTRWKGTTTRTSQKTVKELSEQKTLLLTEIGRREEGKDETNVGISQNHNIQIRMTATTLAWLTVLFEVLFEFCIAYIWYYYHRSFVERKVVKAVLGDGELENPAIDLQKEVNVNEATELQELFKQLQHEIQKHQGDFQNTEKRNGKKDATLENGHINNLINLPIGYYTDAQRKEQIDNLFKHQIGVFKQSFPKNDTMYQDRYTVAHKDFKSGKIKHLNLGNIDNRISIYIGKIQKAFVHQNHGIIPNQLSKLTYWINRRNELLKKIENKVEA